MAAVNGKNYALILANKKAGPGEANGHSKHMYDEYTFLANVASADTLNLGALLPKNARVLSCVLKAPALGGTGTCDVGYAANGVDAASTNGFIAGAATGAGAVQTSGTGVAIGKKFAATTQVVATFTGVSTAATGLVLQLWVAYIVD